MTPLRRRMTEDLILRNRSPKTIRASIGWVADFAQYFHTSPEHLGSEHVRSYLLHLVQERQASWNISKQARLALQFFYRVTLGKDWVVAEVAHAHTPKKLPVVLSQDETARFLDALQDPKHRALLMTASAGGLRLSEVARASRRGHRQRPQGHPRPPGQGVQGPRREALAAAADGPPSVLSG